jgi:glycosyltransferase involved in cell wall biosynthesis
VTGFICQQNTPEELAENVLKLLSDKEIYEKFRIAGYKWSKEINFDRSYEDFKSVLRSVVETQESSLPLLSVK